MAGGPGSYVFGTVRFTDVMLQGGSVATAWVSHVSEQRYTFDAQEV